MKMFSVIEIEPWASCRKALNPVKLFAFTHNVSVHYKPVLWNASLLRLSKRHCNLRVPRKITSSDFELNADKEANIAWKLHEAKKTVLMLEHGSLDAATLVNCLQVLAGVHNYTLRSLHS